MLLTDARRAARTDSDGSMVPLDEQRPDRCGRRWLDYVPASAALAKASRTAF
jgi:predicted RNA polymerase sigma factor